MPRTALISLTLSLFSLTPVPSPRAASANPTVTLVRIQSTKEKKTGIMRTHLDVLQTQHALFDRVLDDDALHEHILFLPETMDAIVRLRLRRIVPREIHAIITMRIKVQSQHRQHTETKIRRCKRTS